MACQGKRVGRVHGLLRTNLPLDANTKLNARYRQVTTESSKYGGLNIPAKA
jgi:hypothetical protein